MDFIIKIRKFEYVLTIYLFFHIIVFADSPVTILTPEGQPVTAYNMTNNASEFTNQIAQDQIDFWGLDAQIIESATRLYNCHSYAWSKSENTGTYWIGYNSSDNDELKYFNDNVWANDGQSSYIVLTGSDTLNATHGCYQPFSWSDHSIRVIQNDYPVAISESKTHVSKWGDGPLVHHAPRNDIFQVMYELEPDFSGNVPIQYSALKTTHSDTLSNYPKTWIGAGGITHTVSSTLTVPSGGSLKIKSGTTVEFTQGVNLVVNGTLTVESDVTFNIPSGSQLVISGTLNTGSNITILSGATLTANSGSQLNFSNGKSLIINGTLTAVGTSSSMITFNFTSPSSTYQNGIKFNSGSGGILSYCNIKNAYHGVKCYSSLPTIQYCDIFNNSTGIYIYNAGSQASKPIRYNNIRNNSTNGIFIYNSTIGNVYGNTITDNGECGIYCTSNGVPYLWENIITGNDQSGVYCIINSPVLFGDRYRNPGYNLITQNATGVTCGLESNVRLGSSSLAGRNSIHDNTGYEVSATYNSYVMAEYNWWNRVPPTYPNYYYSGDFYTFMGGSIDYVPALTYDPIGERMAKTVAYDLNDVESNPQSGSASHSFLDSELSEAMDNLFDGKYEDAIAIYVRRLNKETNKSMQKYILSCIAECYEMSGKDGFIDYLDDVVRQNPSRKDELYAKTLELENYVLMREGKFQKAVANYLTMTNEFADNEIIQKNALFNLGYLHYMALDNQVQGRTYFEEFIEKYPDDDLCMIVYETMGEPEKWTLAKKNAPPISNETSVAVLPSEYRLLNNYPNPFNPTTTIGYQLPESGYVTIRVFDLLGQEVATVFEGVKAAGNHTVILNGERLSSGVYFCVITAGDFCQTRKMLLLR